MLRDEDHQEWARLAVTSSDWSVLRSIEVLLFGPSTCIYVWWSWIPLDVVTMENPIGQTTTGGWMIRDVLMISMVGMQIKVKSKDES